MSMHIHLFVSILCCITPYMRQTLTAYCSQSSPIAAFRLVRFSSSSSSFSFYSFLLLLPRHSKNAKRRREMLKLSRKHRKQKQKRGTATKRVASVYETRKSRWKSELNYTIQFHWIFVVDCCWTVMWVERRCTFLTMNRDHFRSDGQHSF